MNAAIRAVTRAAIYNGWKVKAIYRGWEGLINNEIKDFTSESVSGTINRGGTILRTANALSMDSVILTGDCADVYNPKTVRASMGAVFRQRVFTMTRKEMRAYLSSKGMKLYGAALSDKSRDIRLVELEGCAVAIGSEGKGLSKEFLELCDGEIIIPMNEQCESLNAGVAAAIVMWELCR